MLYFVPLLTGCRLVIAIRFASLDWGLIPIPRYDQFNEGGWLGLSYPEKWGGQGTLNTDVILTSF